MTIISLIQNEFEKRIRDESLYRIISCVDKLDTEELWKRPNENLVSVANLVLHLNGNIRQWIISGIGGKEDLRIRDLEFDTKEGISKQDLLFDLSKTIEDSIAVIKDLDHSSLNEERTVQGFKETVLSIIIHVIEHTSYHTGQITYYTKLTKNIDTKYYGDLDLNIKSDIRD